MSEPSASPGPHSVDRKFILMWGMQFLAYTFDIALWGVAVVLSLQYFRKYTNDPPLIRAVVAILLIVTTIHAVFLVMNDYKDFVSLFGDFDGLDLIPYQTNVMICAGFVVACVAQLFYASRIWVLSGGNWRYVTPVIFLAVLQLAFGIAQTAEVAEVHRYSKLETTVFIAMPGTLIFTIFILSSSHVYVISVCSMLMSRETLRAELRGRDGFISTFALSTVEPNSVQNNADHSSNDSPGIHVATSVIKWADDNMPDENDLNGNHNLKGNKPSLPFVPFFPMLKFKLTGWAVQTWSRVAKLTGL
ncbi:hypothetical protein K438DRAFT_1975541 [Mycena galopus ATCC 62051]|nr:hypothetical protein K438DRAFT_1975541 [Mycena galopus ATCC 62051]